MKLRLISEGNPRISVKFLPLKHYPLTNYMEHNRSLSEFGLFTIQSVWRPSFVTSVCQIKKAAPKVRSQVCFRHQMYAKLHKSVNFTEKYSRNRPKILDKSTEIQAIEGKRAELQQSVNLPPIRLIYGQERWGKTLKKRGKVGQSRVKQLKRSFSTSFETGQLSPWG